jgi:hypothetical protein
MKIMVTGEYNPDGSVKLSRDETTFSRDTAHRYNKVPKYVKLAIAIRDCLIEDPTVSINSLAKKFKVHYQTIDRALVYILNGGCDLPENIKTIVIYRFTVTKTDSSETP